MAVPALNPTPTAPAPTPAMPDPLAGLRDWHLPDPVSWWPPAPGWWLVAALTLGVLVFGLVRWHRRRRAGAAGRAALRELRALRAQAGTSMDARLPTRDFAAAVSILLRRLALTRFPREQVAGLSGAAWLAFLDATGGGDAFTRGPGRVLGEWPYRNPADREPANRDPANRDPEGAAPDTDTPALADLAARWIRANQGTAP